MACPSKPSGTQCPSAPAVTQCPSKPATTQCPSTPAVTQCPSKPATTQCPSTPAVTQCPSKPATTQCPSSPAEINPPVRFIPDNIKIYLSPENQEKFAVNTKSFYENERVQMELLAHELYLYLKNERYCNVTIGDLSIGRDPIDAIKRRDESNAGNYNLHICLHSNAHNGVASGPRIFYLHGDSEGANLAQNIYDKLFPLYKSSFPNANSTDIKNTGEDYLEVRETNATAVLVETAFHDVVADAYWIINKRKDIAKAIGDGIFNYLCIKYS